MSSVAGPRGGSWRWLVAGSSLLVLLLMWLGTLWLLGRGARGAEIANVLALPMTVVGTLLAVLGTLAALGLLVSPGQPRPTPEHAGAQRPGQLADRWWAGIVGRIRRYATIRTGVAMLVVLSVAVTSPFWAAPLAARAQILVAGCKHAIELRILTSQEQLEPARMLADRYRQSARRYGCERVHPYVFALSMRQAQEMIAAGWPESALRAGPQPDVWLAESAWEVDRVRNDPAGEVAGMIASDVAVASSPIVFGLPASIANESNGGLLSRPRPELVKLVMDRDGDVVRPEPTSSPTGELAAALLYGHDAVHAELARSIEQRVGRSLDDGGYPLGDSLDLLCRYRELDPPRTAVIVSEQALARFNNGDPLGGACHSPAGQRDNDDLLVAYYPSDTRSLDHRLVSFGWSPPAQAAAAAGFGTWLAGEDGARALAGVGLRPPRFTPAGLLTARNGVRPDANVNRDPVPANVLVAAMKIHRAAQRRTRVLFALDSSKSMAALADVGQSSRFAVITNGLIGALDRLGEQDEFGLLVFSSDPASTTAKIVVPIQPWDSPIHAKNAIAAALSSIKPAGNTPLHQAIVDGIAEVDVPNLSDKTYSRALVVLTDGRNNVGRLTEAQVVNAVRGKGVRVFMVAFGEASCAVTVMRDVATATGGRCMDATLPSIDATLVELFRALQIED